MSLDKAVKYGKEKRRAYRGAKALSHSCRNNGSCEYCRSNRQHAQRVRDLASREALAEYLTGSDTE